MAGTIQHFILTYTCSAINNHVQILIGNLYVFVNFLFFLQQGCVVLSSTISKMAFIGFHWWPLSLDSLLNSSDPRAPGWVWPTNTAGSVSFALPSKLSSLKQVDSAHASLPPHQPGEVLLLCGRGYTASTVLNRGRAGDRLCSLVKMQTVVHPRRRGQAPGGEGWVVITSGGPSSPRSPMPSSWRPMAFPLLPSSSSISPAFKTADHHTSKSSPRLPFPQSFSGSLGPLRTWQCLPPSRSCSSPRMQLST